MAEGPKPNNETLRHLNAGDMHHIAQMKAAQHSYFKWAIGLGGLFVGLQSTRAMPREVIAPFGLGIAMVAAFTALFILHCHLSMVRKRRRLWKVYRDLHLDEYIFKKEEVHTSYLYGWMVWIPMILICFFIAVWCATSYLGYILGPSGWAATP